MEHYIQDFRQWMERLGYSRDTIKSYTRQFETFISYVQGQRIKDITGIDQSVIERFNAFLHECKHRTQSRGLSASYISSHINVVKQFSRYLQRIGEEPIIHGTITIESEIETPRSILTQEQIKALYEAADDTIYGIRDKAILGLYYGCGLRCREGTRLQLTDIDYGKNTVYVKPSKNYQSRYVPMSEKVKQNLQTYCDHVRKHFERNDTATFLLNQKGKAFTGTGLNQRIKKLCDTAKINKPITLHSLRHSIATHLLQHGMELEQIGRFLGHKTLDATQIYTHIVEDMKTEKPNDTS
jgi:integrase/recombinase XerD